jgi:hypothetical protein
VERSINTVRAIVDHLSGMFMVSYFLYTH